MYRKKKVGETGGVGGAYPELCCCWSCLVSAGEITRTGTEQELGILLPPSESAETTANTSGAHSDLPEPEVQ